MTGTINSTAAGFAGIATGEAAAGTVEIGGTDDAITGFTGVANGKDDAGTGCGLT